MANSLSLQGDLESNLWSAADKGDVSQIKFHLDKGRDVNCRNCLGCTPLLYACGSGHVDAVKLLLEQPSIDVNRRNNDRLTSFMLAMQGGPLIGPADTSWPGWNTCSTHEKLRRLMDLPCTTELELTSHDRWTALMEACNFGHRSIVELLLAVPSLDLEARNLRGQRADEVALSRGHDQIAEIIQAKRQTREQPEEMLQIRELEEKVEHLKAETRNRLLLSIDSKYEELANLRSLHEKEIETMTEQIDALQEQLEEAMKSRLSMITRQVRIVKNAEEEIRQLKRKLENFDRYSSASNLHASQGNFRAASPAAMLVHSPAHSLCSLNHAGSQSNIVDSALFDKDFECSVCLDDMKPPMKIFQCCNGHVMCEVCKNRPEIISCPSCRIPLGPNALLRNIPMEKLAKSYFDAFARPRPLRSSNSQSSRRGSCDQLSSARSRLDALDNW